MNTKKTYLLLLGTLTSIATVLLALVDFRRGFLFHDTDYITKTAFFAFSPLQLVLLLLGLIWFFFFKSSMKEEGVRTTNLMLLGIFILLLLDVLIYRGVAASRALENNKLGTDWLNAFGADGFIKPLALSASYVLTVWHAIVLSCLGAGLGILALPRLFGKWQQQQGWRGTVGGTLYSLTQPFCSCCVAMLAPGLFRSNRPLNFGISVVLGAPLLNISTLVLAASFLPWPFAVLRIAGGLLITITLSFFLSKWFLSDSLEAAGQPNDLISGPAILDTPSEVLTQWLKLSGKIAYILIPSMILGTLLASAFWSLWPQEMGNSVSSVVLVSIVGSLAMISTWSEIPLASHMISHGMNGPAAAALLALPAANIGSLLILSRVSRSWKVPVGLGFGIMAVSALAGFAFL